MAKKGSLGKGLDALFEDNSTDVLGGESGEYVKISEIQPNKNQPRKNFDAETLQQLADSIRQHGVIQPLVLRSLPTGGYQIVAGERRYRASRMAGLVEVPAVIREFTDRETMEIALIENLQREDLNPIEEALGYKDLMIHYNFTQEAVAKSVGKSRPAVTNSLRLLNLPNEVIEMVKSGVLYSGHARTLLAMEDEEEIIELAKKIVDKAFSVREVEKLIKVLKQKKKDDTQESQTQFEKEKQKFKPEDSYYEETRIALHEHLGKKVDISFSDNKGKLVIEFYDKDELKDLVEKLSK